jgi:hypothetical protein
MTAAPTRARPGELLDVLVSGCDERIALDPLTGANKYHLDPTRHEGLFQRGSCTAGTLNPRSECVVSDFLLEYPSRNYEGLLAEQADRLRQVVGGVHQDFDVFFGASGSDLAFYPTMFQAMLHPHRRIVHIVSCPEELGSGSLAASAGRIFARSNQFGEAVGEGDLISTGLEPEVVHLAARNELGQILPRRQQIEMLMASNSDAALIGSLVFGSKSGIVDDLEVIHDYGDRVIWVVDLCQFRVDSELISGLLAQGASVMLTGSKFFGAPPFCAALLVPRSLSERLATAPADAVGPFGKVFSAYDVPPHLKSMRSALPRRENVGLRARWEAALDEMEAYSAWTEPQTNRVIAEWNVCVTGRLMQSQSFDLMPDQHLTNDSIVSLEVVARDGVLDYHQLTKLFEVIVTSEYTGFSAGRSRVFLGQPVRYGDRAFLRLALGATAVREFLESGATDLGDDYRLIEVLEDQAERLYGRPHG